MAIPKCSVCDTEFDASREGKITCYLLVLLARLGIVWDLRQVPAKVKAE